MKIGEAAAVLGIAAHVLRHWESEGLLAPPRGPSGHRGYDEQTLDLARLVRALRSAGLSVSQIRELTRAGYDERIALIGAKRTEIADQIALLNATERFLEHVVSCRHPVVADCPDCSAFAARRVRPSAPVRG